MQDKHARGGGLFGDRNFRWLFAGALVTRAGHRFTLIALPWLVLQMTGDPLVLGTVMAAMAVPRALFTCSAVRFWRHVGGRCRGRPAVHAARSDRGGVAGRCCAASACGSCSWPAAA